MDERAKPSGDYITLRQNTLKGLGIFVKDFVSGEEYPSSFWTQLGYSVAEMSGEKWIEKVHPDDRETARRLYETGLHGSAASKRQSFRIIGTDGLYRWVLSAGVVDEWTEDGKPRRYVGLDVDISELHDLQENLRDAQALAESRAIEAETLRTAGAVIAASLDTADAVSRFLAELQNLVRSDLAIVFEHNNRVPTPILHKDAFSKRERAAIDFFGSEIGQNVLFETGRARAPGETTENSSSERRWLVVPIIFARDVIGWLALGRDGGSRFDGQEIRLAMSIGDFLAIAMHNSRLYERMSTLATTDQLTGLKTRHAFFAAAEPIYEEARGNGGVASCLVLDVDHFKRVNDTYGHLVGDRALRNVAETIKKNLRDNDIVCRFGGEEFCALLPNTNVVAAGEVAQRICEAGAEVVVDDFGRLLTVSIGVATAGDYSLDHLIHLADEALYLAKNNGRNRVEIAQS